MFGDITGLVVLAVLFFVVANPMTYKVVDQLLSAVGMGGQIFDAVTSQVSQFGVALHTVVFVALFCVYQKFVAPMMQGAPMMQDAAAEEAEAEEVEEFMEHEGEEEMSEEEKMMAALGEDAPDGTEGGDGGAPDMSDMPGDGGDPSGEGVDGGGGFQPGEEPFEGFQSGGMGAAY
jgi:hypothetical protein